MPVSIDNPYGYLDSEIDQEADQPQPDFREGGAYPYPPPPDISNLRPYQAPEDPLEVYRNTGMLSDDQVPEPAPEPKRLPIQTGRYFRIQHPAERAAQFRRFGTTTDPASRAVPSELSRRGAGILLPNGHAILSDTGYQPDPGPIEVTHPDGRREIMQVPQGAYGFGSWRHPDREPVAENGGPNPGGGLVGGPGVTPMMAAHNLLLSTQLSRHETMTFQKLDNQRSQIQEQIDNGALSPQDGARALAMIQQRLAPLQQRQMQAQQLQQELGRQAAMQNVAEQASIQNANAGFHTQGSQARVAPLFDPVSGERLPGMFTLDQHGVPHLIRGTEPQRQAQGRGNPEQDQARQQQRQQDQHNALVQRTLREMRTEARPHAGANGQQQSPPWAASHEAFDAEVQRRIDQHYRHAGGEQAGGQAAPSAPPLPAWEAMTPEARAGWDRLTGGQGQAFVNHQHAARIGDGLVARPAQEAAPHEQTLQGLDSLAAQAHQLQSGGGRRDPELRSRYDAVMSDVHELRGLFRTYGTLERMPAAARQRAHAAAARVRAGLPRPIPQTPSQEPQIGGDAPVGGI